MRHELLFDYGLKPAEHVPGPAGLWVPRFRPPWYRVACSSQSGAPELRTLLFNYGVQSTEHALRTSTQPRPALSCRFVLSCVLNIHQVLDADDADVLTGQVTAQLQSWSPTQLAAAVTSALPCLGDIAPTDGQQLALLFAAVGAAARAFSPADAAKVLVVLAQLPGYAPDSQVRVCWCCDTRVCVGSSWAVMWP